MAAWSSSDGGVEDTALCAHFLSSLPVDGAAVSVFGGAVPETVVCATDNLAARLDELQFDLGEGPRWVAARTRLPVLEPRVREGAHPLWPVFSTALMDTVVEALYVFPLTLGALDVGIVELYSRTPGVLDRTDRARALVLANKTAWNLLDRLLCVQESPAVGDAGLASTASPLSRREIHQATGMVLVQMNITATDALLVLRAHAFSHGKTVRTIAGDVVARRLHFSPVND
ncbi:ANTAR domain-containing protein [Cryobacterium sp. TMT1-3]|uniref:ANTAR domain-containing protein n=1 Tax=Cryobacterium luteum TaxID=1424661 RepID=A0A1H8D4Y7_9MICO|nr:MULTISPECIES: GAF and ANTAR domain-containing protein [Cryobacterium]TFB91899.1 ANTAR domain-containing protein [Cryobacterium luteum]TFC31127.1 ANTAR domain-containing protein [Cryobacterium sp. TMT1-3]SEN02380.1 ANTAR domain-containing protein [Cryobacterium luteum]